MIVGKNSAKSGFSWFGRTILKAVTGVAAIGLSFPHQKLYPAVLLIVIAGTALIVYESYKEYKKLED